MAAQDSMPHLPSNFVSVHVYFLLGFVVVGSILWLFKSSRNWLIGRFKTIDYLWDYIEAALGQFGDVFWGVVVGGAFGVVIALAFMTLAIVSQFQTPASLVNWLAILCATILAGYYVWRADHIRLEKKIEIIYLRTNEWTVAAGQPDAGHHAKSYYFGVFNKSEGVTIEGVNVQLNHIQPLAENLGWLPIHLHLQHDNPSNPENQIRSFTLNPNAVRNVDFVSALEGNTIFSVLHVVSHANHTIHFDTDGHRLEVMITASNMPALFVWFRVWRDEAGILMCEMEQ